MWTMKFSGKNYQMNLNLAEKNETLLKQHCLNQNWREKISIVIFIIKV